jgi:excisionase family DNA binding protein
VTCHISPADPDLSSRADERCISCWREVKDEQMIGSIQGRQPPHLTTKEIAQRLRLHPRTLERWRREGAGPPFMKLGGRVLYRQADIEEYEQDGLNRDKAHERA